MSLEMQKADITKLKVDAIVNAANRSLLGGGGVDGAIHRAAGAELLAECRTLGGCETGEAKVTQAYQLPCRYVIHTVGPVVQGALTPWHEETLAKCYRACLALADESGVDSIALCCIATGVYGFPQEAAARIAVGTVRRYLEETDSGMKVIFNVYTGRDEDIYRGLLGGD